MSILATLGMLVASAALPPATGAIVAKCVGSMAEQDKKRQTALQEESQSNPAPQPAAPASPYGIKRDLVGLQRARMAKQQAQAPTRPISPVYPSNGGDMSAEEAFEAWISSSIVITHNESDYITEANLIDSYADYCEVSGYDKLDPEGFLSGLIKFSEPTGYLMVDGDDGAELIYGKFTES